MKREDLVEGAWYDIHDSWFNWMIKFERIAPRSSYEDQQVIWYTARFEETNYVGVGERKWNNGIEYNDFVDMRFIRQMTLVDDKLIKSLINREVGESFGI